MKNIWSLIHKQIFRISILLSVFYSLVFPAYSMPPKNLCERSFIKGTRYEAQKKASQVNDNHLHSDHMDVKRDLELESYYNTYPVDTLPLVRKLIPEGVFPINHRQEYSSRPYLVRIQEWGSAIMARTHYTHKGISRFTNVLFGINSLRGYIRTLQRSNVQHVPPPKYLVPRDAKALVVLVPGGGTRTTGSSVFAATLTHLEKYGIATLAVDPTMHGEGSKEPFPDFQEELRAIGSLVKKYAPEDIPVFVYGHSFGAIFADRLMRMTEESVDFFHPSFKRVLIGSPPVDIAPGKSPSEKIAAFSEYQRELRQLNENLPINSDKRTWTNIVTKISFLGEFYLGYVISQMDQSVPDHKGAGFKVKGDVIAGKHDDLVYKEEAYRKVYGPLENVDEHYYDELPDRITGISTEVRHLLGNYQYSQDVKTPLDVESIVRAVSKELNTTPERLLKQAKSSSHNNPRGDALALIVQEWLNDFSARYWFANFVVNENRKNAARMEQLKKDQEEDYQAALKLYEEYFPENRLISLLKKVVLTQSKKDFQSLQQQLRKLRPDDYFSLPPLSLEELEELDHVKKAERLSRYLLREYLLELEDVNNVVKAKQLSRVILQEHFPEYFKYTTIENIVNSIRSNKRLSQDFDIFPFNQEGNIPKHSILRLPLRIKSYILELFSKYRNEGEPSWMDKVLIKEIRNILIEYDPHTVLFRALENFSTASHSELKKQSLPVLRSYKEQLSQFANYENLNKSLESLIKARSFSDMVQTALLIIRNHSISPVTPGSYLMSRLKRRINDPDFLQQDIISALNSFELPQNIRDQIIRISEPLESLKRAVKEADEEEVLEDARKALKEISGTTYNEIKDLIIKNTPINHVYSLIQFLRRMVSKHTLEEFVKYFPDYPLFNEKVREQYFSGLKNNQILQGILSGDISVEEVWDRRYYPFIKLSSRAAGKNPLYLHQAFKGEEDIHQVLNQFSIPMDTKEKIEKLYESYRKREDFINGKHIPSLEDFSKYLHSGEELTQEQTETYSHRIDKIKENIESIEKLEERQRNLILEKKELENLLDKKSNDDPVHIRNDINHAKQLVQKAFRDAQGNPPASMAKEYKELHEKYYLPLERHIYKMNDVMYRHGAILAERRHNLSFNQFQVEFLKTFQTEEIQTLIVEYLSLVSAWQARRVHLTMRLIPVLIRGEMGAELQKEAVYLYGHVPRMDLATNENSLYFELQTAELRLAEIEAEFFKLNEEIGKKSLKYDELYPSSILTVVNTIQSKNVLNPDLSEDSLSDYLKKGRTVHQINYLWQMYKSLHASLPPELPSLE